MMTAEEARKWRSENPEPTRIATRKWKHKNREKMRGHRAVSYALEKGTLVKLPCQVCGSTHRINAHHEDYSKRLDVIWLCPKHHKERHIQIEAQKSNPRTDQPQIQEETK